MSKGFVVVQHKVWFIIYDRVPFKDLYILILEYFLTKKLITSDGEKNIY